jgi:putative oxidoreductase
MTGTASLGLALLRVMVGIIYLMHGYLVLAVLGPATAGDYTTRMGYPAALAPVLAWYLIVAHLGGGALLVLGVLTRWAALLQVPIMASAVLLYHLRQGFFMTGIVVDATRGVAIAAGYEYALLLLVATVTLALTGGGAPALAGSRP